MKIGILGSGDVAKTLASGFLKHGHQVMMGTRTPEKLTDWAMHAGATAGTFQQAATFAETIVLSVKGTASADALRLAGAENFSGKVVIDTTDPIADLPPDRHGMLQLFTDRNSSLMEQLQDEFPDARFVKAFNQVGVASMVNPHFELGKPTMFICGNDDAAKRSVTDILDAFGWEAADMGSAPAARAIEPLCVLWCIPGFRENQWTHAFKLLKR